MFAKQPVSETHDYKISACADSPVLQALTR